MNIEQIKKTLKTSEYDFLREDKNLGDNIILLTLIRKNLHLTV